MKILLTGGGSGGTVSPLLSVAQAILKQHSHANFLFVGGKQGPEEKMVLAAKIEFKSVSAGKFRRYFSLQNAVSPFLLAAGFFQARKIIKEFKPNVVFGAGSFVQVPVIWAAWSLKIPVIIHQQDYVPSLANKLCQIAAEKITVTFEKSLTDFESGVGLFYKKPKNKAVLTGNPFRRELLDYTKEEGQKYFRLSKDFPTLLVLGGGTGSEAINKLIINALPRLLKSVQVIHIGGKGKSLASGFERYYPIDFTPNIGRAYAAADIVLSRCGLSTLTELSNLKKVSILVPLPNSHQVFNGRLMAVEKAAIVIPQRELSAEILEKIIKELLFNYELQKFLTSRISKIMPKDADHKIAKIIIDLVNDSTRK